MKMLMFNEKLFALKLQNVKTPALISMSMKADTMAINSLRRFQIQI